jgi:uncharacterized membrane protein
VARIESSIDINASPQKVWSLITWDRVPEWYDSIKKVTWTSNGRMEVGATVHVLSDIAGVKGEWDAEITEFVDNQSVSWRTTSGNPTIIYQATLTPSKTGAKVTTAFDYELPYSVLGKIIDKLRVHKALEKEAERALQKMKSAVEKPCLEKK